LEPKKGNDLGFFVPLVYSIIIYSRIRCFEQYTDWDCEMREHVLVMPHVGCWVPPRPGARTPLSLSMIV